MAFCLKSAKGLLRRHLPEARDAGSANPCDGRVDYAAAIGELTKSAENETKKSARLGSVNCAKL
jgi:hypothetical protein